MPANRSSPTPEEGRYADDDVTALALRLRRVNTGKDRGIAHLFGLVMLVMTVLAVLASTNIRLENGLTVWQTLGTMVGYTEDEPYGGIAFGMSPSQAQRIRPDMTLNAAAGTEVAGSYVWNGIRYSVAFTDIDGHRRAYRFHSVRTIGSDDAESFLASLMNRHGAPIENDCGKRVFEPMSYCHFAWLTPGGIALRVSTRPELAINGEARTAIAVAALDTYLDGKRQSRVAAVTP